MWQIAAELHIMPLFVLFTLKCSSVNNSSYRLLYLLQQETSSTELRTECAVVLGSLAMGTENNVKSLLDCHIIPALLQGILAFL